MSVDGSPDTIVVIHGSHAHTWWRRMANRGYPWWRQWSLFCNALRKAYGRPCDIREFWWTGNNTHQARLDAGARLSAFISSQYAGRKVHLVGHSHGGNVALTAVRLLPAGTVDTLVLLANPNLRVLNNKAWNWVYWTGVQGRVRQIWNLYSPQDRVQSRASRFFHGLPSTSRANVRIDPQLPDADESGVRNGAIPWHPAGAAHRAMHSEAAGAVAGGLLRGSSLEDAMHAAGLAMNRPNAVKDRGGFGGTAAAQEMIRANAKPDPFDFGQDHREVGLLFLHGFTASPSEMRPIAEFIHSRTGWRCKAPLLPGHGTTAAELRATSGLDWLAFAKSAYAALAQDCRHVFIVGMSMGAALGCHIAADPNAHRSLKGLLLLAPAFGISRRRAAVLPLVRRIRQVRSKGPVAAHYFLDRKLFSYLEDPLDRVTDVLRLGRQAWANLGRLKGVPIILFYGDLDKTVSLRWIHASRRLHPWIEAVRLPRSRHILTVEPDREELFGKCLKFMETCLAQSQR